jgi:hypothetical protein
MASLPAWVTIANISELIKLAALLIGGWWTWTLFVRQRTGVARANLSQTVKDWSLTARTPRPRQRGRYPGMARDRAPGAGPDPRRLLRGAG